jgi:hypothetical protein
MQQHNHDHVLLAPGTPGITSIPKGRCLDPDARHIWRAVLVKYVDVYVVTQTQVSG